MDPNFSRSRLYQCVAYLLIASMWVGLIWWILAWWLTPIHWFGSTWSYHWLRPTGYMDMYEASYVMYITPLVGMVMSAYLYLAIPRSSMPLPTPAEKAPARWTNHIFAVLRPGGVVKVGEALWVAATWSLFVWYFSRSTWQRFKDLENGHHGHGAQGFAKHMWQQRWDVIADRFGWLSYMIFQFLFFPISRGSPLLRATGISFEHGIKYHRWIGHATMWLGAIHSFAYWILWIQEGVFWKQVWRWQKFEINNLAGEIDFFIGAAMWVTSLAYFRRRWFKVFFYTHQLYLVFVLFLALHIGEWAFVYAGPPLVLFGIDRLLRALQSRNTVKASSATVLADGSVELTLPTAQGFQYKALDTIFVNIPELSHLQWHPFSISSAPMDSEASLSIIVKPEGKWTKALAALVSTKPKELRLRVEGPYGVETDFLTRYDRLVLVAGGIGVTPFLSLIRDLIHRAKLGQSKLPECVTLIWAVPDQKSLELLRLLQLPAESGGKTGAVNHPLVDIQVHVTREDGSHKLEAEKGDQLADAANTKVEWGDRDAPVKPLVAAGNDVAGAAIWMFVYGGAFAMLAVFVRWVINDTDYSYFPLWGRAFIYFVAILLGLVVSLAIAIAVYKWIQLQAPQDVKKEGTKGETLAGRSEFELLPPMHISHGHPDFRRILFDLVQDCTPLGEGFGAESKTKHSVMRDIGVLVCGPQDMVTDVALNCSRFNPNLFAFNKHYTIGFHDISFEL